MPKSKQCTNIELRSNIELFSGLVFIQLPDDHYCHWWTICFNRAHILPKNVICRDWSFHLFTWHNIPEPKYFLLKWFSIFFMPLESSISQISFNIPLHKKKVPYLKLFNLGNMISFNYENEPLGLSPEFSRLGWMLLKWTKQMHLRQHKCFWFFILKEDQVIMKQQ